MEGDCDDYDEQSTMADVVSVLLWRHRVGMAAYNSGTCQVSCSDVAVTLEGLNEVPIRSLMDVPGDILWVAQFLSVKRPRAVLIPSADSQVLLDIAYLCGVDVVLTAPCEFDEGRIWDILGLLWADVTRLEWHSRICPEKHVMLMALSALLPYLQRCDCPIGDIVESSPLGLLYVDQDTLLGLQLLRTEPHPMDYQGIGRSKEGLSLLSVVDRTCSILGRALLRQWFALPLCDEAELHRRYDVVSFFVRQENHELMLQLRRSLRHLRYPGSIFTKMRAAKHTTSDYGSLLRCVKGFLKITSLLSPQAHILPTFLRIVASCQTALLGEMSKRLEDGIALVRDPDETLNRTYVQIRPGYDATLDELRSHAARLDEVLTGVAQEESRCLPPLWGPCAVVCVFVPQWGYVITIPQWPPSIAMDGLPTDWELLLHTEDGPFFKTPLTRRMDEELGDLRSAVLEREGEVQRKLDRRLLELSSALIPLHYCAELDCLIGFALCALEGQWSRPQIVEEVGVLEIDRGVHPIFTRTTSQQVVPYSLVVRNSSDRVCVVTGANGSGKSFFITAVVHTVFLAHIGSYVPCAHATIGLMDTLMALQAASAAGHNRDMASTAKELHSSFGGELVSMSRMLQRCSVRGRVGGAGAGRSLLVVDEFGKGTLSMDGAALLTAAIRTIIMLGDQRPIVLLATHYAEAVHPQLVPRDEIQMLEMLTTLTEARRVGRDMVNRRVGYDEFMVVDQQLVHSYRVTPAQRINNANGSSQKEVASYALQFALQFSVPVLLLQRAWDIILTEEL
ncbi:mismatch repair protein MSH5 [Trypanosoma grayi]|uniref:mismatch repair protein MSH5 n=1 Tax=Trypanosoma grayi TaxID=71804 RepID=UPI0004F492E3|nr:mismatch repair protein MSH5 [Trypanosoma grayi]KEG13811.1 mismatch repair protein MSH5 [Trypanosoma grayi]